MPVYLADFPSGGQGRYGAPGQELLRKIYVVSEGSMIDDLRPGADGTGKVWRIGSGENLYLAFILPDVANRFCFSFRIYLPGLPGGTGNAPVFQLREMTEGVNMSTMIPPDGVIGTGAIVAGAWQLLEVMWGAGGSNTGLQIRIDGELVVNNNNGTISRPANPSYQFRIFCDSGGPTFFTIKDLVLQGGADAAFLGPCNVRQLQPTSDISSGWVRTGAASDFAVLDNSPPATDQYIADADPLSAPSVTQLAGLSAATKTIRGLHSSVYASTDTPASIQTSLVGGGTPRDGTVKALTTIPSYYLDRFPVDPVTGQLWTPENVAALRLSINRTA